eukprot:TRINITY_DN74396_c0_g1_i1.p1 TRINITY_DN74396_c0_g1~~TRINITY_DN74396_c0_g1_i1.p1  ORF type:complete len:389 (+),score=51.31 TRINITY_DN74396_c0_g1_i1:89-1255(+)
MKRLLAQIGEPISSVTTPALVLDLTALQRNVDAMAASMVPFSKSVRLRPHGKAFKSSTLCRHLGYERLCCQTVREAETMVEGGCTDVLVTNQVVGRSKLQRLVALAAGGARIGALVDNKVHVADLQAAASSVGLGGNCERAIDAYVEIDAGQQRCGVAPGSAEAVALVKAIIEAPSLRFAGLHVYHGGIQHVRSAVERRRAVLEGPVARAQATLDRLLSEGVACDIVTGGGSGTYLWEAEGGVHNEVQPGSFLFMDGDYAQNEVGRGFAAFEQSLFVRATVISCDEKARRRVIDAGSKAIDLLSGAPRLSPVLDTAFTNESMSTSIEYILGGDKHGILTNVLENTLPVGAQVQLIPSHCDPTVNLFDSFIGVRNGVVEKVFPIDGRGW